MNNDWQPIGTAQRDGKHFDVLCSNGAKISDCYYSTCYRQIMQSGVSNLHTAMLMKSSEYWRPVLWKLSPEQNKKEVVK